MNASPTTLMTLLRSRAARVLFFTSMALASAFITVGSLGYFHPEELHPFVIEKLPVAHEELWLRALSTHVVAAALCFPACLLLMSRTLIRRAPRAHRILGRVTGVAVLVALVPSGAVLAFEAKGGALSTAGFLLSGAIVFVSMVRGVMHARARRFAAHRRATAHVLAQMSVAATSRALLVVLDAAGVSEHTAYLVSLWLPVLASAAFVELIHARSQDRAFTVPSAPSRSGGNMRPAVSLVSFSLALALLSSGAHAAPEGAALTEAVVALVQKDLVVPLKKKEDNQSRFSRARMPARDRRVRVLDATPTKDKNGDSFLTFAIDERHALLDETEWSAAALEGCVYPDNGRIFIKRGDGYRSAAFLLGKKAKTPDAGVCQPHAANDAPATASAPATPSQT